MASSSEGADLTTERHTVAKKRRQNSSNISSKTKDHTEYLHSTAFNGNRQPSSQHLLSHTTAIAEKRFPKRQTISNQEPPPNFQDQSHGAGHQTASTQRGPDAQPRLKLGSLSSFLETRGRGQKRQIPAKSPYFTSKDVQAPGQPSNDIQASVQEDQPKTNTVASKTTHTSLIQLVQAPRTPANHEGIVLFTSTALLKTHPRVLQCLEGLEHPPKLVYRDYAKSSVTPKHQTRPQPHYHQIQTQTPRSPLPIEADIILSPKTGIILTISQATIQLYLPGHKSTLTEAITNTNTSQASIKSINSPLRESIFRLSSRYEHLYIFITHNPEQSKHSKNRLTNLHLSADKHLLASLTSLNAFCTSLSNSNPAGQSQYQHASITPLLIPFTPESVANWILALAHNHICVIPPSIPHFGSEPGYRIAFTPVNPQPQLAGLLGDSESIWELFLRRAGLNPFAARVVLAVLGRGIEDEDGRYGVGCLSRFVEMSAEERRGLFGGIIGGKILKRVESLIERDWQCDWALRFDDEI
ncbi:uncharacterized protein BDV17DRAFT_275858, partial [Aspergillus undulatus]|uniref:uncharacterized protein n=1 Tax=Aspergillus undulatus TaxID=1810928 RepID=UPI003CCD02C7